ncbi:zinc dependent phospholipase C family protein [Hymenobacter sp. BT175]|uniref:zinc dependent phospholipase C family protein n=1 Tax=Hymenobacter translucens TaxID=2886507 RepID=UPI001D0F3026|nr:zinc dependent phospholipase C family protein [Hymenobacter translucens]MCC2548202.1 zinc dependent phospholipase C family protein [Hymenobacter translucens]
MLKWVIRSVALLLLAPFSASGYSVLTHQATIDSAWKKCLVPLLQRRYPGATDEQLREAKSYAYGGAIIQDMGYYPFGSSLFTNLTHYVRSGDFVHNLFDEARDRNDFAFALGALAHYAADISGHLEGTNRAVASVYPDLKAQFGPVITYLQAPKQHSQLEFAFDVVQVAAGRYRSEDYHSAIGFQVAKPVLERAFEKTYGLKLGRVIANVDLSIGSYRFVISQLVPTATRAAWESQREQIRQLSPRVRRREFVYRQSRREFRREFGTSYKQPGTGARLLSLVVRVLPKIGPLRPFAFKLPTREAQELFKASFRTVQSQYCGLAEARQSSTAARLPNTDFDTGYATRAGEYELADETYGEWVRTLAKDKFEGISAPLRQNILTFYSGAVKEPVGQEEKETDTLKETQAAVAALRAFEVK